MIRKFLVLACLAVLTGCSTVSEAPKSAELVLIDQGKSNMVIAVPDVIENKTTEKLLLGYAREFSKILAEGSGVKLPVVRESRLAAGQPAIMVGKTRFAVDNGIDFAKLRLWEAVIKVSGNRLILAGIDGPHNQDAGGITWRQQLGSVRAITEFLQKYAGVRFLIPGKNGIQVPPFKRLAVAGGTDRHLRPRYIYGRRRPLDLLHEIANGYFNAIDTKLYGGHSYYTAVPAKQYFASHPEYFHVVGGSRSPHGGHLCISNPEVQELMLKEMTKQCDLGYDCVELSQTDAYVPCVCENCRKLFNTSDESEKLWLFHCSLAERFAKIRPGKKVMIIAYGPTSQPPKTFRKFPSNVRIELCRYDEETLEKWTQYEVPHGFTVYLYNWGCYHTIGFGPKRTVAYLEDQLKLFRKYDIRALYFCGIGELYGLEGPQYYIYNTMMAADRIDGAAAMKEYCRAAFGKASAPMEKFYAAIDNALGAYQKNLRSARLRILKPGGVIPGTFTPDVIELLERQLKAAEAIAAEPKVKARLRLVRAEFDFFNATVRSVAFYNAYRLAPTQAMFDQLEKEVGRREQLLNRFFPQKTDQARVKRLPGWEKIPVFGPGAVRRMVRANGSSGAAMGAPFDWNFRLLREKKILPFKTMQRLTVKRASGDAFNFDFEKGDWAKAKWIDVTGIQLALPSVPTRFKTLYDSKYFYVAFDGEVKNVRKYQPMGQDGNCWGQDGFEIMIDPFGDRVRHYHLLFNFLPDSRYDARMGFVENWLDPNFNKSDPTWNGKWDYKVRLTDKRVQAVVRLEIGSMQVPPPAKGTIWTGNFGREEFHDGIKNPELLLWSPNPEARNFHDRDKFGEMVFE